MRYLGSKDKIRGYILKVLKEEGLLREGLTFFDAFCGMGSVSDAVKDFYNLEINDILSCCTTFTAAKLFSKNIKFDNLSFNPFSVLIKTRLLSMAFSTTTIRLPNQSACILRVRMQGALTFFVIRFKVGTMKKLLIKNNIHTYWAVC